jgi:glycerol-3-phosphate dehydrogenase
MIFAIPRGRTTYIGTTDTNYYENIDDVHTQKEDTEYLIKAINQTFTNADLTVNDVESSWAGLRPLIHEEGKSAEELSRKDEIFESHSGLISIAGGKLTGYRKMAERVVDLVIKKYFDNSDNYREKLKSCSTDSVHITQPFFKNYDEVKEYISSVEETLKPFSLQNRAEYLVTAFGKQTDEIISLLKKENEHDVDLCLTFAELNFCFEKEMILSASDFFVRRTGMLYFNLPLLKKVIEPCLQKMKTIFNWGDEEFINQKREMELLIEKASHF